MTSIVVLGDIHGNASALKAALITAKQGPLDELVFLGDLLTYGPDVAEVLELTSREIANGARLVCGNHDQLYFDLAVGDCRYFDKLPSWIQESVRATNTALDFSAFRRLAWETSVELHGGLFAHANPYGGKDFNYLNSPQMAAQAISTLAERGFRFGVFAHTHRPQAIVDGHELPVSQPLNLNWQQSPLLLNAGAVGQPRAIPPDSYILRLSITEQKAHVNFEKFEYDVGEHLDGIRRLGLNPDTEMKLCSFFKTF